MHRWVRKATWSYTALMAETPGDELHLEELRQLILQAFEEARDSGKADWEAMRSAVLKNRLLQLTNREFDENRYGGGSMVAVALRIPGLLELTSERPAVLKLSNPDMLASEATHSIEKRSPARAVRWSDVRIRQDLWRAVVAPRNECSYVWDPEDGQAREASVLDGPEHLTLPSFSEEELVRLRATFVEEQVEDPEMRERLAPWVADPATRIPKRVRNEWLENLKNLAVARIQEWFQFVGLTVPGDLVQYASPADLPITADVVRTRTLKAALLRAIQIMDDDELRQVLVPATVLMRYEQER